MTNDKALKIASLVIDYLKSSGDLSTLPDVIRTLEKKAIGLGLQDSAIVTSPVKLGLSELKSISAFIKAKFGQDIRVVEKIDPGLIAGFTIQVGDEVIDSSLASKLENIRKELV